MGRREVFEVLDKRFFMVISVDGFNMFVCGEGFVIWEEYKGEGIMLL